MFGDVIGKGIPHKNEKSLNDIKQCATECNKIKQCNSFRFGRSTCKLLSDILPIDPGSLRMVFCIKCKYLFLLLFYSNYKDNKDTTNQSFFLTLRTEL